MNLYAFGKTLVQVGLLMVLLGGLLLLAGKAGVPFGRLPGDLSFRGKHFILFAPIGSMLLLSLFLTILLNLFLRWFK
ncbi:MAG: DUF2905 family protein [Synergistaceae bacterium]|jgi:hypothetical protein|nr:DUF2905 family protein [Synergistaceae bacterium]